MKKICADLLKEDASKGIKTPQDLYRVIERLVICFVSVVEEQNTQSLEIYGNGTPGGLKVAVLAIKEAQERMHEDIEEIRDGLEKMELLDKQNTTSFDKFVRWFIDKILPSIVITLFLFVVNLLGIVFVVSTAISMGIVKIP